MIAIKNESYRYSQMVSNLTIFKEQIEYFV